MDFPALTQVGAIDFFSEYGKAIFNPTGIFYWTGRAKNEARINATIGSARGKKSAIFDGADDSAITLCIPSIKEMFPDFSTEEVFPYAPEVGTPAFREAWKNWLLKKAGDQADEIRKYIMSPMIVPGITGAISICTRLFVGEKKSIIVPDKRWENYDNIFFRNIGVHVEEFPAFQGQEFNQEGLLESIRRVWLTQRCAVVLLNFPNNPTGYCPPKAAARELVSAIQDLVENRPDRKLVLLLDDAYEGYVYDEDAEVWSLFYHFVPAPNFIPIKLDGISKEMLWYGARIGAVTIALPEEWLGMKGVVNELENKFKGVVRNTVSNCSLVAQSAAKQALQNPDQVMAERQKTISLLAERYHLMKQELAKVKTEILQPDPFQGGFFCFINLAPEAGLKATEVCDHLLKQYQVGAVPLEREGINGIRLAFCGVESDDIPELCQSLEKAVNDLKK
ncbi:MAG: aminotransferase class I/II-fold pyridoxal phosphate-dependent enzyme [bacterium]|jgi:aspartate/methionine/tyrosine aminotransferase